MRRFVRKRLYLSALTLLLGFNLSASFTSVVIPLSSSLYQDMDLLYLLEGQGTPSTARPWSVGEATKLLESAYPTKHSALYEAIRDELTISPTIVFDDEFALGLSATINTELYAHSNGEEFGSEHDWVRTFIQRKPLIKGELDLYLGEKIAIHTDLQYGRNRFNSQDSYSSYPDGIGAIIPPNTGRVVTSATYLYSKPFLTNILPLSQSYDMDLETPKRAVISLGSGPWNITLGRDRLSWGNGKSGNFIIGDHTDYHEFARFKYFSKYFSYDWLNIFLQTNPDPGEREDESIRIFMTHRLEFQLFNRVTVALSENIMYVNNSFDLQYFNPAFIYHNLNNASMFNAIAHAEADISIIPGLNIYGQFVLDQARAPNEPDTQADALGYLTGVEYAQALPVGYLHSSLEFALTTPVLYRRSKADFLMFRKYFTHGVPTSLGYLLALDYIGYQYGSDTRLLQFDLGYRLPPAFDVNFKMILMQQGEVDIFTSNNGIVTIRDATPSGDTIKEKMILSLSGTYEYPLSFADLSFWAQLDWVGKRTFTKSSSSYADFGSDLQFTLGMGITF